MPALDVGVDVLSRFAVVIAEYDFHVPILFVFMVPVKNVFENLGNLLRSLFLRNTSSVVRIGIHPDGINWYAFAPLRQLNRFVLLTELCQFTGRFSIKMRILVDLYDHGDLPGINPQEVWASIRNASTRGTGCHCLIPGVGWVPKCIDDRVTKDFLDSLGYFWIAAGTDSFFYAFRTQ